MLRFSLLLLLAGPACSPGVNELQCGDEVTGSFSQTESLTIGSSGKSAALASIRYLNGSKTTTASLSCEIVDTQWQAVSPAIEFSSDAEVYDAAGYRITLPYSNIQSEELSAIHVASIAPAGDAQLIPAGDVAINGDGTISFNVNYLGKYQLVVTPPLNRTVDKHRAIVGVSMGGSGALSTVLANPGQFSFLANLCGAPGPDRDYAINFIKEHVLGGFCDSEHQAQGEGNVGELCPSRRPVFTEQFELTSTFDALLSQQGEGIGLTMNRRLYLKALRDMSRALGNPTSYNPAHPYLPAGVPLSYLSQTRADQCANTVVLDDYYDVRFNPAGAHQVLTFCDGTDEVGMPGVFSQTAPHDNPWQVLLAVDVNGNGQRDFGEPIIFQDQEPWDDFGVDKLPDESETGLLGAYHPTKNPDPAGDNFHHIHNPLGTEDNFRYDPGEDYEDLGLDGVACPGSCPYDFGEGDGTHTVNPNVARWLAEGIQTDVTVPANLRIWQDAGIRDFFNAHVAMDRANGRLFAQGHRSRASHGFERLSNVADEALFDAIDVDWSTIPDDVYVKYGDPNASEEEITQGNGRHVGTATQLIHRFTATFSWLSYHMPGGDRSLAAGPAETIEKTYTSNTGRESPYIVFLPPGYNDEKNSEKRYPVVYILHGYGAGSDPTLGAIFETFMLNETVAEENRMQKMIVVFPDGKCRPGGGLPLPSGGDQCETGTFFLDAPAEGARIGTDLTELITIIDNDYRTL